MVKYSGGQQRLPSWCLSLSLSLFPKTRTVLTLWRAQEEQSFVMNSVTCFKGVHQ